MNSLRKWLLKPKRTDQSLLAKFYYADEELNAVASELDSFDGRKDTTRCNNLVLKLRNHQDSVLSIVEQIMKEVIPLSRARRDYRIKFPEEVLQENLAGQLWFGAECLAAGSSIVNKEIESLTMRPLARTFTKQLDELRSLLREQCFRNLYSYNEEITKALVNFDKLFADFELSYVSAMVPVKSMKEYDLLQDITVLFCETVSRSMKLGLLNQDQFDSYDPSLMFTIPRLAIICGLLVFPDGPLNPDQDPCQVSEMFRQQQTLLFKIRELLVTLQPDELRALEELICDPTEGATTMTHVSKSIDSTQPPEMELKSGEAKEFLHGEENDGVIPGIKVLVEVPQKKKKLKSYSWPEDGNENHSSAAASTISEQTADKDAKPQSRSSHHRHISRGSSSPFPPRPQAPYTMRSISWRGSNEFNFLLPRNTSVDQQLVDSNNVPYNSNISTITDDTHHDTCGADGTARYRDSFHNRQVLRFLQAGRTAAQLTGHEVASNEGTCQYNGARPKQYRSRRWTSSDQGEFKLRNHRDHLEQQFLAGGSEIVQTSNQNSQDEEIKHHLEGGFDIISASQIGITSNPLDNILSREMKTVSETNSCGNLQVTSQSDHSADPITSMCTQFSNCPINKTHNFCNQQISVDQSSDLKKIFSEQNVNNTNNNNINVGDIPTLSGGIERSHDLEDTSSHLNHSSNGQLHYYGYGDFPASRLNGYRSRPPLANRESESTGSSSSCTSPMNFVAEHEEISRIIQIAEQVAGLEARSKFKSSSDLVHQLFVCISKVADQLQTNFASDFRHILKATFECYSTGSDDVEEGANEDSTNNHETSSFQQGSVVGSNVTSRNNHIPGIPFSEDPGFEIDQAVIDALEHLADIHMIACREESFEPPAWVPDECCSHCMSCKVPFNFVRRRHHCRNCGKIFCNQCSSNSVALPHIGHAKPVRVCNGCYLFHLIPFTNTSH